jgi:hypothetical protein
VVCEGLSVPDVDIGLGALAELRAALIEPGEEPGRFLD